MRVQFIYDTPDDVFVDIELPDDIEDPEDLDQFVRDECPRPDVNLFAWIQVDD
jgi:hypothetical protein